MSTVEVCIFPAVAEAGTPSAFSSTNSLPSRRRELRERLRSWLAAASDALVGLIFPADCRICGALLTDSRRVPICTPCFASFDRLLAPVCGICGSPLFGLPLKEGQPALAKTKPMDLLVRAASQFIRDRWSPRFSC